MKNITYRIEFTVDLTPEQVVWVKSLQDGNGFVPLYTSQIVPLLSRREAHVMFRLVPEAYEVAK